MLGKLLKYEFKATGRGMLLFYLAVLVLTIINRISGSIENIVRGDVHTLSLLGEFPVIITWMLYIACIAAVAVFTLVLVVQRFYKNLLQNEGYLMHVLPVKNWQHIMTKLLTSMVWTILSVLVIICSVVIVSGIGMADLGEGLSQISNLYSALCSELGAGCTTASTVEGIIIAILTCSAAILQFYAAMAVGQMADKHKVLASFGAFIGFNIAESFIETTGLTIIGAFTDFDFMNSWNINTGNAMVGALFCLMVWTIIGNIVYFAITEILLRKHLNLQ